MKKHLEPILAVSLLGAMLALGCDDSGSDNGLAGDGGDEHSTDTGTTEQPQVCDLSMMEGFDAMDPLTGGLPAGWTILAGGGSGSGSGSGAGTIDGGNTDTWHHTTIESERFLPDAVKNNMTGGIFKVGDVVGINESLQTGFYDIGACKSVSLSFKQFFEDFASNDSERGEVWVLVDGPPWELVKTIDASSIPVGESSYYSQETIDLSSYLVGGLSFQVKFVYTDNNQGNWPWFIDDVAIIGTE